MPYEITGTLRWAELAQTGNGWNVLFHRVGMENRKFYGISSASVARLESIINRDDYHNFHIELGRTGWAEIQLYPEAVLKIPWKSM